jgi:histidyl-tRNA synthetase
MLKRPRGTEDVLPPESTHWHYVEERARQAAGRFGFQEVRTPLFEHTELFRHGAGEATDIVEKEMYTFPDRAGRSLTLRPESTAAVARALLQAGWLPQRLKLFYIQSHFRYERPEAGRLRQHAQFGVEYFGEADPYADVEVIALAVSFLEELGLTGVTVQLNSIGDEHCRPRYREALVDFLRARGDRLCTDCRRRLETNPLRLLDCKVPTCVAARKGHPETVDYLCAACRDHFQRVTELLSALGVAFRVDPTVVRGIDYYTRTVFEVSAHGASVLGGGRYDGLAAQLGGPPTPAVGFGLGIERLLALLREVGGLPSPRAAAPVFLAVTEASLRAPALRVAHDLRRAGVGVDLDLSGRSLKSQLRLADRLGVAYVLILGPKEAQAGVVTVRRLADGEQEAVPMAELVARLRAREVTA